MSTFEAKNIKDVPELYRRTVINNCQIAKKNDLLVTIQLQYIDKGGYDDIEIVLYGIYMNTKEWIDSYVATGGIWRYVSPDNFLSENDLVEVDVKYKINVIGTIDLGCDGDDTYLLYSRNDDDLDLDHVKEHALRSYWAYSNRPGGYFRTSVSGVFLEGSTSKAIITVHGRYDN